MTDDPERLVAEALRAHAARTPLPNNGNNGTTGPALGGYGLLSGSDLPLRAPEPAPATMRDPAVAEDTHRIRTQRGLAVGWVLLLAVLLGLAAGAVVGLVTLL